MKLHIFLTGGVYTPYAPCMSTPLLPTDQNTIYSVIYLLRRYVQRCN